MFLLNEELFRAPESSKSQGFAMETANLEGFCFSLFHTTKQRVRKHGFKSLSSDFTCASAAQVYVSRSWYLRCVGGEIGILDLRKGAKCDIICTWYSCMVNRMCGI